VLNIESERVMKNIKLIEVRKKRRLTQVEVAKKVGISEVSYQRIEYGTQRPSLDTAILIARSVKSTVEKLFGPA
jgi:DNA-binding XRE family transcriptional regulator